MTGYLLEALCIYAVLAALATVSLFAVVGLVARGELKDALFVRREDKQ